MPTPLAPETLRWTCDPATFEFETTEGLPHADLLTHQTRPLGALRLALRMKRLDYNVFVSGAPRLSKTRTVKALTAAEASTRPTPRDWVYVYNFAEPDAPVPLSLPPGRGKAFAHDLHAAVEGLKEEIGQVLYGEAQGRARQALIRTFEEEREALLGPVEAVAWSQGFILDRAKLEAAPRRGQLDPADLLLPVDGEDGAAVAALLQEAGLTPPNPRQPPSEGASAPKAGEGEGEGEEEGEADRRMRQQAVLDRLEQLLWKLERARERLDREIDALHRGAAQGAIKPVLAPLMLAHGGEEPVAEHLRTLEADILSNLPLFLGEAAGGAPGEEPPDEENDGLSRSLRRYYANVIVDNTATEGAPVILEGNPTYANLIGRIEQEANQGVLSTHFLRIKGGSLLRAIGGFLIIRAEDLLQDPAAFEALKRAIRQREVRLEDPGDSGSAFTARWLKPGPIPLKGTRVILTGTEETLEDLSAEDPDFEKLFKVIAQFNEVGPRALIAEEALPGFVSALGDREGLLPLDRGGVAALAELALRDGEDRNYLSTRQGFVADLVREGDYFARERGASIVGAADLMEVWRNRRERTGLLADRIFEDIARGFIHFKPKGGIVGQIHGLVVSEGLFEEGFGYPCRITAKVGAGAGRISSIEREVKLGGPIYGKGVLTMEGFLRSKIAHRAPLRARISVVMEQAYVPIEGDSASAAELVVILSALSQLPLRQDLALTGAVDQRGLILPVGGINEKIEGMFRACSDFGLSGTQGVLIPQDNLPHLQLDQKVVAAAASRRFAIYSVGTVEEALELLFGCPAQAVFDAAEQGLKVLAKAGRSHGDRRGGDRSLDEGEGDSEHTDAP